MTDLEAQWLQIHALIDRGYSHCPGCLRIVEPISLQSQHLLDFGDAFRGVMHGKRSDYRAPYCPHCGAELAKRRRKPDSGQRCTPCSRDWPESFKHCALCGAELSLDVAVVLGDAGQKDGDAAWEEFKALFDGYFHTSSITPEKVRRLEELSAGANKQTSREWLKLMAADQAAAAEEA